MLELMEQLDTLLSPEVSAWVKFVFMIIGGAAVAAANLPRGDGKNILWGLIDWIAQNYSKAKNKK